MSNMIAKKKKSGAVHSMPADLRKALASDKAARATWEDVTPLARNEWICWITSAKKSETREHRIKVGLSKLTAGDRRPCCWMGCVHRKDKPMSPSQTFVLSKGSKKAKWRAR